MRSGTRVCRYAYTSKVPGVHVVVLLLSVWSCSAYDVECR